MIEPGNLTAWVDKSGGTWARLDEQRSPHQWGPWWPLTDGPGFEPRAQDGIGQPRPWSQVLEYGPFTQADPERTARALERVRREFAR